MVVFIISCSLLHRLCHLLPFNYLLNTDFLLWGSVPKFTAAQLQSTLVLDWAHCVQPPSEDKCWRPSLSSSLWTEWDGKGGTTGGERSDPCTSVYTHMWWTPSSNSLSSSWCCWPLTVPDNPRRNPFSFYTGKWQRQPRAERASSLAGDSRAAARQHAEPGAPVSQPSA